MDDKTLARTIDSAIEAAKRKSAAYKQTSDKRAAETNKRLAAVNEIIERSLTRHPVMYAIDLVSIEPVLSPPANSLANLAKMPPDACEIPPEGMEYQVFDCRNKALAAAEFERTVMSGYYTDFDRTCADLPRSVVAHWVWRGLSTACRDLHGYVPSEYFKEIDPSGTPERRAAMEQGNLSWGHVASTLVNKLFTIGRRLIQVRVEPAKYFAACLLHFRDNRHAYFQSGSDEHRTWPRLKTLLSTSRVAPYTVRDATVRDPEKRRDKTVELFERAGMSTENANMLVDSQVRAAEGKIGIRCHVVKIAGTWWTHELLDMYCDEISYVGAPRVCIDDEHVAKYKAQLLRIAEMRRLEELENFAWHDWNNRLDPTALQRHARAAIRDFMVRVDDHLPPHTRLELADIRASYSKEWRSLMPVNYAHPVWQFFLALLPSPKDLQDYDTKRRAEILRGDVLPHVQWESTCLPGEEYLRFGDTPPDLHPYSYANYHLRPRLHHGRLAVSLASDYGIDTLQNSEQSS